MARSDRGFEATRERRRDLERARLFDEFRELGAPRVESRLRGQLDALPPLMVLEQRLFALWIAQVTRQLREHTEGMIELAHAAIELAQHLIVTQRQVDVDVLDSFEDDDFLGRTMTILASGLGNCEISNYIVWSVLRAAGHRVYWFETGLPEELEGAHLFLYAVGPEGGAFVDAWSDIPCFHLDGFVPRLPGLRGRWRMARCASRRPPSVPTHAELAERMDLSTHGLYPRRAITAGIIRADPSMSTIRAAAESSSSARVVVEPVWRDYVALRCRHINGELGHPAAEYAQFARRDDLTDPLRAIVEALAKRAQDRSGVPGHS